MRFPHSDKQNQRTLLSSGRALQGQSLQAWTFDDGGQEKKASQLSQTQRKRSLRCVGC
jgi:hypothetical protein